MARPFVKGDPRINRTRPGPGRPPDAVRHQLREILHKRTDLVAAIADGKPTQTLRLPLREIAPLLECRKCGEPLSAKKGKREVEIKVEAGATVRDRLSALELAGRYGLGQLKEVSVENVRERVKKTLDVLAKHLPQEQYAALVADIRPVWT